MPVVELDTIKASDAFGSGSSPDGHTKKTPPCGVSFVCLWDRLEPVVRARGYIPDALPRLRLRKRQFPDGHTKRC